MRQLSTRVLVGQADGRKKVYPVNFVEEEPEDTLMVHDHDGLDEETAIQMLAEQGDEEALIVQDFEDQLIEVCQDNSDLSMCLNSYTEARAKIRDKLKHRGFWPPRAPGKGRGKFGKKGGRGEPMMNRKKGQTLAERIANSTCRRCGQRGHWKQECPQRNMDKEEVHLAFEEIAAEPEEEILTELPEEIRAMQSFEAMLQEMLAKDRVESTSHPIPSQVFETVNVEFEETANSLYYFLGDDKSQRSLLEISSVRHCAGRLRLRRVAHQFCW